MGATRIIKCVNKTDDGVSKNAARTSVDLRIALGTSEFNIYEVDLQLLLSLDTNQERGTATSGDDLVGVVGGLEDECEGTLELLENGLHELGEARALVGLRVVNVLREDSGSFGIGLTLEFVPALLKDETERSRVGHNAVVNDGKLSLGV